MNYEKYEAEERWKAAIAQLVWTILVIFATIVALILVGLVLTD